MRALARSRVPVLSRAAVVEVTGDGRAEVAATVARLDDEGRPQPGRRRQNQRSTPCAWGRALCHGAGLARSLGCEHRVNSGPGYWRRRRDRNGRTSVDGVWVAGDGGGIAGAQVAQAMGTLASLDPALFLGWPADDRVAERRRVAGRRAGPARVVPGVLVAPLFCAPAAGPAGHAEHRDLPV